MDNDAVAPPKMGCCLVGSVEGEDGDEGGELRVAGCECTVDSHGDMAFLADELAEFPRLRHLEHQALPVVGRVPSVWYVEAGVLELRVGWLDLDLY